MEESAVLGRKLAPYNPTNAECVSLALELLDIRDNDILYDLGCGDGRFLVQVHLHVYRFCEITLGIKTIWYSINRD
jgi:precorrin-6B methylase 2